LNTVGGPVALFARVFEPLFYCWLQPVQSKIYVFRLARYWRGSVELTARVLELEGVQQVPALVALVSARIVIVAEWTCALDEAIGKETLVGLAVWLGCDLLLQIAVLV